MIIRMARCDNPKCGRTSTPENNPTKPTKKDQYISPYGWIQLDGWRVGCGPTLNIEVCSAECLTPAVNEKLRIYEIEG